MNKQAYLLIKQASTLKKNNHCDYILSINADYISAHAQIISYNADKNSDNYFLKWKFRVMMPFLLREK